MSFQRLFFTMCLIFGLLGANKANASICTVNGGSEFIFSQIRFYGSPNMVAGTALSPWYFSTNSGSSSRFTCPQGTYRPAINLALSRSNITYMDELGSYPVYYTDGNGANKIGVVIRLGTSNSSPNLEPVTSSSGNGIWVGNNAFNATNNTPFKYLIGIRYISLANRLKAGQRLTVNEYTLAVNTQIVTKQQPNTGVGVGSLVADNGFAFDVAGSACTLKNDSITLRLPTLSASNITSSGSTASPPQSFVLQNCPIAVGVYATISDASNLANISNVIGLSSASTAHGVGVQILFHDQVQSLGPVPLSPVDFGGHGQFFAGKTDSSELLIPLSARYIATGGNVGAGKVYAQAYITFSYQ